MSVIRRAGAVAALAVIPLLLWAGPADAHAYLDHSNPADGSTVAVAPDTLRLAFSEHVVLSATTLRLLDADEKEVPLTGLRLVSDDPGETEAPAEIVADLPALPTGAYRLAWSTLSSDDLHRTSGVLAFGVRTAVAGGGIEEASPDPAEVVAGALLLGGTALLLGAPLAVRTLRVAPAPVRRRVRRVGVVGGLVALAAGLVGPAREVAAGDAAVLLAGGYAVRWALRTTGLVLMVHGIRADGRRAVLIAGAALAATGQAMLGHAWAQTAGDPFRIPVTTLHLLAGLGWTGAVAGIALGLGTRPQARLPVPALRAALRSFAVPAAAGLALTVATGVWLASDVVISADAAVLTSYGRTLLVKLVVVGAVGGLALVNHRRLRGRRDLAVPRRSIAAEAVAAAGLVAVTALLLAGQPATEPQLADSGPRPSNGPAARQVGDLEETISLRPNRAGPSVVLIGVFDRRRPATGPISEVTVTVGSADLGIARPLGDGHWSAQVPELPRGPIPITVTVARDGVEPVPATYSWVVGDAAHTPATVISRSPLDRPLRLLAAALVAIAAGVGSVFLRRRRSRDLTRALIAAASNEEPAQP
jgi:copper transport protein